MNSIVVEKIKKLLSLGQSDNPNERDLALAKAQALATEHEIDMALLDLSDVGRVKEEEMNESEVLVGKRFDVQRRFVGQVVKTFCKVEWVRGWRVNPETGRTEVTMCFLGRKSDTELAKWLYSYLMDEYTRRWNAEARLKGLPGSHRNTFFLGLRDGQLARIAEEGKSTEQTVIAAREASAPTVNVAQKLQLARVDEETARKAFTAQKYPSLRSARARGITLRSNDTYSSGTAHGRTMSMNRPLN